MNPTELNITVCQEEEISWTNSSLIEAINIACPFGWEEFFTSDSVKKELEVISKVIQEQTAIKTVESQDEKQIQASSIQRTVWPKLSHVFNAFDMCSYFNLKCVIIGQDPYPTPGVAYGLSFSSAPGAPTPASLKNVFKKLRMEGYTTDNSYLGSWVKQGVFLINTALTIPEKVEADKIVFSSTAEKRNFNTHLDLWEPFTIALFKYLRNKKNVVWILWGKHAQCYAYLLDPVNNCIIQGSHPSPLNRMGDFLGTEYFKPCNNYLISKGIRPINWNLQK